MGRGRVHLRFPEPSDARQFSEDCLLTLLTNVNRLEDIDLPSQGYACSDIHVGHQEPTNIVHFALRLARDMEWGMESVRAYLAAIGSDDGAAIQETSKKFQDMRSDSFQSIKVALEDSRNYRHILGQKWLEKIRDVVGEHLDLLRKPKQGADSFSWVDWATHKTQHQICKDIVEDHHVFDAVLRSIELGAFGYDFIRIIRGCSQNARQRFPEACRILGTIDRNTVRDALTTDRYLFHLHSIAEESDALAVQFLAATGAPLPEPLAQMPPERLEYLRRKYPFDLGLVLQRCLNKDRPLSVSCDPHSSPDYCCGPIGSLQSYAAFLWRRTEVASADDHRELFLRYFNVTGRDTFSSDSPRRAVYLHVLGERILQKVENITNADSSKPTTTRLGRVETIYPDLEHATASYAGPERRAPFDRFMQSIYLQHSIRKRASPLSVRALTDTQCLQISECLGDFLGNLHGVTLGLRRHIEDCYFNSTRKDKLKKEHLHYSLVRLIVEHLNQVRLFPQRAYRSWLERGMDNPGCVEDLMQQIERERGFVGLEVAKLIRQDGLSLPEIWTELVQDSINEHHAFGAIGHQGLYAANLLIAKTDSPADSITKIYVSNHSSIAIVDPAVEAGTVLAELIIARISSCVANRDCFDKTLYALASHSLPAVVNAFRTRYSEVLLSRVPDKENKKRLNPFLSEMAFEGTRELLTRVSRIAAITLLTRYHDRREYDLNAAERRQLVRICVDLLHEGTTLKLRFRN